MTRRQSNNQWRGGITSHPATITKFRVQIYAGKFLVSVFGDKTAFSSLNLFQRAKLSTLSIAHLCWCNWRIFWRKTPTPRSDPKGSCCCTTMSMLTCRLQPRRNWPNLNSNIFITHPILRIWLRQTTTCSLAWKDNRKVVIFHPTQRSLLLRKPGWTDKTWDFMSCLNC